MVGRDHDGIFAVILSFELQLNAYFLKGHLDKIPHGGGYPGGDHVVLRLILLEDHPHGFDIVFGVPPIAAGIEVTEK